MLRKILIATAVIYLLGVVGVGGKYLSRNWTDEWPLSDQLASAVKIGAAWPALVVWIITRA